MKPSENMHRDILVTRKHWEENEFISFLLANSLRQTHEPPV